jgi:glycosyltransferase involved in cell wall biosynthesis
MRKGAGIKNKLLQAWAMGKPIVTTSLALGGLAAKDGENILVADKPDLFAAKTISLLGDAQWRQLLAQRGRETVLQHHTWQQQVDLLEERLREL